MVKNRCNKPNYKYLKSEPCTPESVDTCQGDQILIIIDFVFKVSTYLQCKSNFWVSYLLGDIDGFTEDALSVSRHFERRRISTHYCRKRECCLTYVTPPWVDVPEFYVTRTNNYGQ